MYLLTMLQRVFFGPLKEPAHAEHEPVRDLCFRELAALAPIAVLCVALGVAPGPVLDVAKPDVDVIAGIADRARERAARPAQAGEPVGHAFVNQPSERETQ